MTNQVGLDSSPFFLEKSEKNSSIEFIQETKDVLEGIYSTFNLIEAKLLSGVPSNISKSADDQESTFNSRVTTTTVALLLKKFKASPVASVRLLCEVLRRGACFSKT